jgi:hypothetical protein
MQAPRPLPSSLQVCSPAPPPGQLQLTCAPAMQGLFPLPSHEATSSASAHSPDQNRIGPFYPEVSERR